MQSFRTTNRKNRYQTESSKSLRELENPLLKELQKYDPFLTGVRKQEKPNGKVITYFYTNEEDSWTVTENIQNPPPVIKPKRPPLHERLTRTDRLRRVRSRFQYRRRVQYRRRRRVRYRRRFDIRVGALDVHPTFAEDFKRPNKRFASRWSNKSKRGVTQSKGITPSGEKAFARKPIQALKRKRTLSRKRQRLHKVEEHFRL